MKRPYTIFLDSAHWGCLPNLVTCSRIYRFLIKNNHQIISDPTKADFIFISTCGVLKYFEDISINLYQKYYPIKKKDARIIVYGCLIKTNLDLLKNLEIIPISIDDDIKLNELFYSKAKFENIKPICDEETKSNVIADRETYVFLKSMPLFATKMFLPFSKKLRKKYFYILKEITQTNRMFVEISKGCIGNCSYCVIKKAKGNLHSRKINDILNDIESIYDPLKTLFLVADDCGCYGADIGSNLTELIYEINKKFPNITIDLNNLNLKILQMDAESYLKLFKNSSFRYVIIPLQSGSNSIIKKMNRDYDPKKIIEITDQLKKLSPSSILYAHFIIGYPGETFIDFIKTLGAAIHYDFPLPFRYIQMKKSATKPISTKEFKFIVELRCFIFMLLANIIILSRILSYKLNPEVEVNKEK